MRVKQTCYAAIAFCLVANGQVSGAWSDKSAGLPWLEIFSSRDMGADQNQWIVHADNMGRLFVGGTDVMVFDGVNWKKIPVGNSLAVRTLQPGENDRIWLGGLNEIGYVEETSVGNFHYVSLINKLPEAEIPVGDIWECGIVGEMVYFIGSDKVFRWDGDSFKIWKFPSENSVRLFSMKLGRELWMHHITTGLIRLTTEGPVTEFLPAQLPDVGILGLAHDSSGLLLVSSNGFYRPGYPANRVFNEDANQYIINNKLACYTTLVDGTHAVGTLYGGMAFIDLHGKLQRIVGSLDGLPSQTVLSITRDGTNHAWCSASGGIFRIEQSGTVTLFNALNGLPSGAVTMDHKQDQFYASNASGLFQLRSDSDQYTSSQVQPLFKKTYNAIKIHHNGLLMGRHGGIDYFDGNEIKEIYPLISDGVSEINADRFFPNSFFLTERKNLARLVMTLDGSFQHDRFAKFTDYVSGLRQTSPEQLLIGTASQGIFLKTSPAKELVSITDPDTHNTLRGPSLFGEQHSVPLVFVENKIMGVDQAHRELRVLQRIAQFKPIAIQEHFLIEGSIVAFKRLEAPNTSTWGQGIGLFSLNPNGTSNWHEFNVPALDKIGFVQCMSVSIDNNRPVLWLGGTEGVLRLDYDAIPALTAPTSPHIRLDRDQSSKSRHENLIDFSFRDHRVAFKVFTGDYSLSKDWLIQTRLGQDLGAWSTATRQRSFEFSNLSEGNYTFEARTINAAGMTSTPTVFTFRIFPPWYRTNSAYIIYALIIIFGGWLLMRYRERRIRHQNEKLETLVRVRTDELVKANAAKDEFLAGVSHEIRNPMNGVIGISESLQIEGLDQDNRHKFGLLRQCASHLSSLLEDILDTSKVQAGVLELDSKTFDLHELVESITAMTASDSEQYRIPVEVAISPAVPRKLVGDPRRIRQILLNFVSNGLKFSGRGQVNVTVWCKPAKVSGQTEVIFAVSDDGPGISPEEQGKLFTRFERGAAAQQGRIPGTGLGLALCKGFAEKMGGKIWLESEPDKGSCFYFSAPFASITDTESPPESPAPPADNDIRNALVVDDQEYNRIVLVDLLTKLGLKAQSTDDGAKALDLASQVDFELIFLDYDLPGMTGLEVAVGIRSLTSASARAYILATTAFSTPEKQAQCLAAGMNAFLGKPVTMERLRHSLSAVANTPPPPAPPIQPRDSLSNLRLLAEKKDVRFAEELSLYLSELQLEIEQLGLAINTEDTAEAAHYAHLLCGRCSFIYERILEQLLREIEEAVTNGRWPTAQQQFKDLQSAAAELRVRLVSAVPAAPPA